ncbi:MAG TPA: PQQ-dependent sugar dehydrogenase [Candidatus Limnocylindrales bacterium]|nr:PQQ-dependent sugar dehydrogenase [Candidatus Limnocylindrales bacterium]
MRALRLALLLLLVSHGVPGGIPCANCAEPSTSATRSNTLSALPLQAYRQFALLHQGEPSRGKQLFEDENKIACAKCHTVDGSAGRAGPDLFAVGDKFGRGDIVDSILHPSQTIAEGYAATTIETKGEEVYTGVIKRATADSIELMLGDARLIRIPTQDIAARYNSEISLMPDGLVSGLALQEFTDLIEYLVSLKQPQSVSLIENGMPADIVSIPKPVRFEPFPDDTLKFEHPVWFGPIPGENSAFLVVEHETGNIWRLDCGPAGNTRSLFVNLEQYLKGTRGLLGMALHPKFLENRKYYYAKHLVKDGKFATYIFEREAAPDYRTDSGHPPRLILKIDETTGVHYGGGLQFGPDGFFYIGMGDSGPQEDPQGHGQDTTLLLGKMLRIDLGAVAERPYSIPSDNPFVGRGDVRPEIWAFGLREPWRFSFDPLTGELWVGDVGQDRYEEVDIVRRGENYGWNVYEGFEPFSNRYRKIGVTYIPPVFSYGRKFGVSVTGGFVYRADPKSSFYGVYVFGDFQSQRVWGLTQEQRKLRQIRQLAVAPQRVVSFGRDTKGELYVVGYEGTIYRIHLEESAFD